MVEGRHAGVQRGQGRLSAAVRRIEGQVRGCSGWSRATTTAFDILTQIGRGHKALQAVSLALIEQHLGHCRQ